VPRRQIGYGVTARRRSLGCLRRGQDHTPAGAEANSREAGPRTVAGQNYLVTVFKKAAFLPVWQLHRLGSFPAQFQKATTVFLLGSRNGATGYQVARPNWAAI